MTRKIEFLRELIHLLLGIILIALIYFLEMNLAMILIGLLFLIGGLISVLIKFRVRLPLIQFVLDWAEKIIHLVERSKEKKIPGESALIFVLGIFLTVLIFQSKTVIFGALIVMVLGDGFSTLFGEKFGRIRTFGNRSLEGTVIGILVSFAFLATFLPFKIAIIAAIIGMLSEYLPLNDNLVIPLITGLTLKFLLGM